MKLQLRCTEKGLKSNSLKRLAEEMSKRLGYKVWRTTKKNPKALQLRWGAEANKLHQYEEFKEGGLSSLEFTTDKAVAGMWWEQGHTVFGRKTLKGSEGKGIVIFEPSEPVSKEEILACQVFTKYIPKKREFRVHIFKNKVVGIVEKRKKKDWDKPSNPKIRNTANGYVFCQTVELTESLRKRIDVLALAAGQVCGSDFKGVDLGYNLKHDNLFVIEVNSAPGIEGSNVKHYCDAIQQSI